MASQAKVISPSKLAHVVLKTHRFREMVEYYKNFLGAVASFENDMISFLRYDEEHHRIAIVYIPSLVDKPKDAAGMEHIAFSFDTLDDLVQGYKQRKALGIVPSICLNHGPAMSMYYVDPDGNRLETEVDNFDSSEEATAFMTSEAFARNPIGVRYDPEELVRRLESGEPRELIKQRPDTVDQSKARL